MKASTTRDKLMRRLAAVRKALGDHGIRDSSDYAEVLVAEALGGKRQSSRVTKGHDVIAQPFGRIEVKSRQLPRDGRVEERVAIGDSKARGFDYLAVVIFEPDFGVKGAVLISYAAVWDVVKRQRFNRVSYTEACRLPGAMDVTEAVRAAAQVEGTGDHVPARRARRISSRRDRS